MTPFSTTEKRIPMGLAFLIAVLKKHGHNVHFIDNYLEPSPFLENDFLMKNNIDLVGIQVNTICLRDSLRMLYLLQDMRERKKWNGRIVAGGPHASVSPETIPNFVDHIVQGEGENALLDIVNGNARERIVQYPPMSNLDELPRPSWESFVHLKYDFTAEHLREKPIFPMNTSRGCPFRCTFCSVGSIWGKRYNFFSPERIVDDIQYLISTYKAQGIYFREDNFTFSKKRVYEFCELLLKKNIKIKWLCESRVNNLDQDMLKLMHRSGCSWIYLGLESGSRKILDYLKKDITTEQTLDVLNLCRKIGINVYGSFITGVPTETEDDRRKTADLIGTGLLGSHCINVFVGIPNSDLYRQILDSGDYEYIDDRGLVYIRDHDALVERFYPGRVFTKIPNRLAEDKLNFSDKTLLVEGKHNLLSGLTPNFKTEHFIARHRFLEQYLKPGQRALDMNSLLGISTARIAESGSVATGWLNSEKEMIFARGHLHDDRLKLSIMNQTNPEWEGDMFDVITSFDYIEMTPYEEACRHIKETYRRLKPGGFLIGTVHILIDELYPQKHIRPFDHNAVNYTFETINRLLCQSFRDIEYHYAGGFVTFVARKPEEGGCDAKKVGNSMVSNLLFPWAKDLIFFNQTRTARKLILGFGWRSLFHYKIITLFILSYLPRNILSGLQKFSLIRSLFDKIKR
jgi:radical SAM superfamily enzyme YgiQ (UPF0313 family)